jgi:hypothetical protein
MSAIRIKQGLEVQKREERDPAEVDA